MHQKTLQDKVQEVINTKGNLGTADEAKIIISDVSEQLGDHPDLHEVTAFNVFEDKWLVNVWIKRYEHEDSIAPSYSIAHSFFCTVHENWIVDSNPEIEKLY